MKTLKKLGEIKGISLLLIFIITVAQSQAVIITSIEDSQFMSYTVEGDEGHHYYACDSCSPTFAYESNESFLKLGKERIDIKERLTDIPLMKFYRGKSAENKYLLFFSRTHACGGAFCEDWYYYVVPLKKMPHDTCRMVSLCQFRIPKPGQNLIDEAVFRDMIARWEKDHQCFND